MLALTCSGRGFVKADLNHLSASDCTVIEGLGKGLLVVPYVRLASLIEAQCTSDNPMLVLPSIRMQPSETTQLAQLSASLPGWDRVFLAKVHVTSALSRTQTRAETLIARRCTAVAGNRFGRPPHTWLRRDRGTNYRRFSIQTFDCGAH